MPSSYDASQLPILIIRAFGRNDEDDIRERLAFLDEHLAHEQDVLLITDARESETASASGRRLWTDWLRANETAIRRCCVGYVMVSESAVMRGVTTAVFWFWVPPFPWCVCRTREEAIAWARAQLADHTAGRDA